MGRGTAGLVLGGPGWAGCSHSASRNRVKTLQVNLVREKSSGAEVLENKRNLMRVLFQHYPWITHGSSMDSPWIIHGLSMDHSWIS